MTLPFGAADAVPGVRSRPLPRRSLRATGVDAGVVHRFLDVLEADPEIEPHSMMLVHGGAVVAEGWWAPYSADRVHHLYSLSKTFTALAVGVRGGRTAPHPGRPHRRPLPRVRRRDR